MNKEIKKAVKLVSESIIFGVATHVIAAHCARHTDGVKNSLKVILGGMATALILNYMDV